jgi:hypothetical protein
MVMMIGWLLSSTWTIVGDREQIRRRCLRSVSWRERVILVACRLLQIGEPVRRGCTLPEEIMMRSLDPCQHLARSRKQPLRDCSLW